MDTTADPAFRQFLDSARIAEAIRSRSGRSALREHLADDASVPGLLANLSDRGVAVALTMTSGRERHGFLELVGDTGIVIRSLTGIRSILQLRLVASIRTSEPSYFAGDGKVDISRSWPTLIASLIEPSDEVTVVGGGQMITGFIVSCSRSLLTLCLPSGNWHYAVVDAIEEVSLNVPGSIRHD
jgi:hypothetical protein